MTVTEREKVNGVTETCTARHVETAEIMVEMRHEVTTEIKCTEAREIEGELDGVREIKDEHTHTEVVEDNGGELVGCLETRCEQLDGLLQERGEGICPLEATHDQVGSVVPSGVEGASAVDGCTESLGGMEAPGALEVTRFPSMIVPVCAVKGVSAPPCVDETPGMSETPCARATPCASGVVASVSECVLPSTPCVRGAPRVSGAACVQETARVCEQPCGSEARCVSEAPRVSAPACVNGMVCVCVRETA